MSMDIYLAYLATVAVFFATPPGTSQILMITNAARHGLCRSLTCAAGDLSANVLQMLAAGFGLAVLIASSGSLLQIIKWVGVAYLVVVALRTFFAAPADTSSVDGQPRTTGRQLFLQGFLTSSANPEAIFFFAALFPQFLDPSLPIWPQLLILGATYLAFDAVTLVLFGASSEKIMGRLAGRGRLLNRISGSMMLGAAGLLAAKDVHAR